ncbi:MAG: MFS transporter [Firmicutes bacterium HGW-Firmicutes-16]|nr:MAG: MFS transporter [Firmicutes bacterium HGW-Firmicutes-16]
MRGKKYLWTLAAVYMAYLTHGIQAIIISQNLDQFVVQWGTDAAGVYKIIAYTGLAKFVSVWICGELSDKIGRKLMIAIGAVMYIGFFAGLLTTTSFAVAGVCAFMAGLATSFFDGACYPAAQESWNKAPSSAVILIKGVISVSGLVYPLLLVSLKAAGNWQVGIIIPIVMSVLIFALAILAPYSYDKELKEKRAKTKELKAAGKTADKLTKEEKLDADAQRAAARFVKKPPLGVTIGCALYGFIAMATMYSAQQLLKRYGLTVIGMDELTAASLTSLYTFGSIAAVLTWAFMMAKLRWRTLKVLLIDLAGSILAYILVCTVKSAVVVQIASAAIGFFAAGGALQCGVSLIQEFHPGNKGRNLGIYYTFMGLASYAMPQIQSWFTADVGEGQAIVNSMLLNLGLAVVGACFMVYLALNYKKWFGVSVFSKKGEDE